MVLENQSIICFATDPWDSMWRNRHQIMSRLARKNKVLYIEPKIYSIPELIKHRVGLRRTLIPKSVQSERLKRLTNGLWLYQHPYWGIGSRLPVLKHLGLRLRLFAIRRAIKKLEMQSCILWIVDPRHFNISKYLEKSVVCYHVVDNYSAAPYYSEEVRSDLEKAEKKILSGADLVIVTSPFLREEKSKYNTNVHLVKNAVDYEKFAFSDSSPKVPKDMEHIPKLVIGYIGAVNEKLDFELLDTVARTRPKWSFVLVGAYDSKQGSRVSKFVSEHPPNVFLLGKRNVEDIPDYIHACDICILPYCRNDYTKAIDSLKLYEYFACEKPVVATDIPVIREHSQAVYIAQDANDFVYKLEEAMASSTPARRILQRSIAMQNTWDQRVEQLSFILHEALLKKSNIVGNTDQTTYWMF